MRLIFKATEKPLQDYEVEQGKRIVEAFEVDMKTVSLHDAVLAWRAYSDDHYCCGWLVINAKDTSEHIRSLVLPYLREA